MGACCHADHCGALDRIFSPSWAESDLRDYRAHGPSKPTLWLLEAIRARVGARAGTLLDIGGGVGPIHHEWLKAEGARAVDVDAAQAYIDVSRQEAQRLGHADRIDYRFGNFVDLAPDLAPADVVTLDRVVCCFPDAVSLVREAAGHTRRLLGLVMPRDEWMARAARTGMNLGMWIMRNPYRFYVHATADVIAVAREAGLQPVFHRRTWFWQTLLFERAG